MNLMCVNGIPERGLFSGSLYTELARYNCHCATRRHQLVSVAESAGRTKPVLWCGKIAPATPNGWYLASRFVLMPPPPVVKKTEKKKETA